MILITLAITVSFDESMWFGLVATIPMAILLTYFKFEKRFGRFSSYIWSAPLVASVALLAFLLICVMWMPYCWPTEEDRGLSETLRTRRFIVGTAVALLLMHGFLVVSLFRHPLDDIESLQRGRHK